MAERPVVREFIRYQGETVDYLLRLPQSGAGSSFLLVANRQRDPRDATSNAFEIAGAIDAQDNTLVRFPPQPADTQIDEAVYYLTAWQTTSEGRDRIAGFASMDFRRAPVPA